MRRSEQRIRKMFEESFPSPPPAETEEVCERVFRRLDCGAAPAGAAPLDHPARVRRPRSVSVAMAFAVVLLLCIALALMFKQTADLTAIVENEDGTTYRLVAGETLRTDVWTRLKLTLPGGSRVEMRSQSELELEDARDGVRIRLSKGSVFVSATKQAAGHLYVETKDAEVSVIGTVFLVAVEEAGTRVAVVEGQVRVKQGALARDLLAGQELVTNPAMESPSP